MANKKEFTDMEDKDKEKEIKKIADIEKIIGKQKNMSAREILRTVYIGPFSIKAVIMKPERNKGKKYEVVVTGSKEDNFNPLANTASIPTEDYDKRENREIPLVIL